MKTIGAYCEREKIHIVEPTAQKYRDTHTFIESINEKIVRSLRHNERTVVVVKESMLNDAGYFDYIFNLMVGFRDASYFNSLDTVVGSQLKKQLISIAKDQHQL